MIKKINSLIANDKLREKYQKKAKIKAESFKMETIINEWEKVLNS